MPAMTELRGLWQEARGQAPTLSEAYTLLPGTTAAGVLLLCDHASNALPADYGTLGLPPAAFERHIAYDIGAADVTAHLSALLGAPAVLSRYSRLLVDCNRGADDPTLVMRLSDGTIIPGNRHVTAADIGGRITRYHEPYHAAVAGLIDRQLEVAPPPVLLSIHSFTDRWKGAPRPWHAAVLWDKDPRFAGVLLAGLRASGEFVIGDNEPYSGRLAGDSMWRHGTRRGLAHAIVEIRQDLIGEAKAARVWAERLAGIIRDALADDARRADLQVIQHHGSCTDGA
jgi:predicted N-formylglutamate amidohydrolase